MIVKLLKWSGPWREAYIVNVDGIPTGMVYEFDGVWMRSGCVEVYESCEFAVQAVIDARVATGVAS
jgi:hypothetical protein